MRGEPIVPHTGHLLQTKETYSGDRHNRGEWSREIQMFTHNTRSPAEFYVEKHFLHPTNE
jgi:hypothetical protein